MKQMTDLLIFIGTAQVCAEAHASAIHPVLDDLLQTLEAPPQMNRIFVVSI